MKKVIVGILALIMAFGMVACKREVSPSDQVARDLDEIKTEDVGEDTAQSLAGDNDQYKKESQEFIKLVREFDYEIKGEKISEDGKTATVTVVITTYDFGKAYNDACDQVLKDAADGKLDEMEDAERTDYVYKAVFANLLGVKEKTYSKEVDIKCQKDEEGDWDTEIDENKELQDAVMGGIITSLGNVS